MKKGLFNHRIPTLVALLILVIIISISMYLIQSGIFYVGKAAPDTQPQNFLITNVTDTSFTAVFTTLGLTDAVVSMNDAKTGSSLTLDDRDKKSGAQNKYYSHHITVPNLTPNTTYVFKLIVGGKQYSSSTYALKTGQPIASPPPEQNPLFGKVLLPDGAPGSDTVVVAKTDQSANTSAVTDEKGEFILPTNSMRNTSGTEYVVLSENTPMALTFSRQQMTATVTTTFLAAQNLPPVTLSQQYTFVEGEDEPVSGDSEFGFTSPTEGQAVSIKTPYNEEVFTDTRPLFTGTSYPNSSVALNISEVGNNNIITKADGSWSYRPETDMAPGEHSISITATDASGGKERADAVFSILPAGSQINSLLGPTTTPTAVPPTPTPTTLPSTPTPTPAPLSPTPTTTASTSPTLSPTIEPPTSTPLPTIFVTPTKQPPINPPGGMGEAAALTGLSIILIVAGIALLIAL